MNARCISTLLLLAAATLPLDAQTPAGTPANAPPPGAWRIDKSHSVLDFSIRHFMSRVRGTFRDWQGQITLADPTRWETGTVEVAIQTASIFTDNDRRDADLRSENFFAADSFPVITFRSTKVERAGTDARIHGLLTIRGRTRPVVLEGRFLGLQRTQNQQGTTERIGFEASTTINRVEYGVSWNRAVEGGGVMLGDDVKIDIAIEAIRRLPVPPAP
jgi:polyisoprenoid-binding protein YceI